MVTATVRATAFEADVFQWIIVSHLLNAPLTRELCQALVKVGGRGEIGWTTLFEDQVSAGPSYLANLALRHRSNAGPVASFLAEAVGALVALNDDPPTAHLDRLGSEEHRRLGAFSYAFQLARADSASFGALRSQLGEPPEVLKPAFAALTMAGAWVEPPSKDALRELSGILPVPSPLKAAIIKHAGDLNLDADRPGVALILYDAARQVLGMESLEAWSKFATDLEWMIRQSEAAARRDYQGPKAAAAVLTPLLQSEPLSSAPLLRVNGVADAFNAEVLSSDNFVIPEINRTQVLYAPQLSSSHDLGAALAAWRNGDWMRADRLFWATLRRQIALGCASETRRTKGFFARSLVEQLTETLRRERNVDAFRLAVRLLLQSGETAATSKTSWPQPLLEAYLTSDIVEHAVACVDAHAGSALERRLVLIALLRDWLLALPAASEALAPKMLGVLAAIARDDPFGMLQGRAHAHDSLKALQQVAEKRPDLAQLASTPVADAVVARLSIGEFRPAWAALDTAYAFAGAFTPDDLRRCIDAVLATLEIIEPAAGAWPVIRPALGLISEEPAQTLWPKDPELASRSARTVLRFGLGSAGENARLMFLLKDVSAYLQLSPGEAETLNNVVIDLRRRAHQINSSEVTNCISALLASPAMVGAEGVRDALDALREVLESASGARRSIGLAFAYQPLLQLAQSRQRLQLDLGLDAPDLKAMLHPVLDALLTFWRAAAQDPLVFTTFSIPRATAPNPVIVHNWTFATLGFAEAIDALAEVEPLLAAVAVNPELAKTIAIARAVRLPADAHEALSADVIRTEREEAFYAALGQRLIQLPREDYDTQIRVLQVLLQQCLRLGPHGLDAAVFALAAQARVTITLPDQAVSYRQRLAFHENLKFSLSALLGALEPARG